MIHIFSLAVALLMTTITACTPTGVRDAGLEGAASVHQTWDQCAKMAIADSLGECKKLGFSEAMCFGAGGRGREIAIIDRCGDNPATSRDNLTDSDKEFLNKECVNTNYTTGYIFGSFLERPEATRNTAKAYCNKIFANAERDRQQRELTRKRKIEIRVGSPESDVYDKFGDPDVTNKTVTRYGVSKQLVYSNLYIYIDNGKVSAFQQTY